MAFNPLDLRRGNRASRLRDKTPEEAVVELERVLYESIAAQQSGSRMFQSSAIKELKQLRSDMQLGHVNAGSKQSNMIGAYSHVIDQLEQMENRNSGDNKKFDGTLKTLGRSIPSADTFVAALMTANPLVGYGVKIMKDIGASRLAARKARLQEKKERARIAQAEMDHIQKMLKAEEEKEEFFEEEKGEKEKNRNTDLEKSFEETYEPVLFEMRDTLHNIEHTLAGDLERVDTTNDLIEQQIEAERENVEDQIKAMEDLEKDRERNSKLKRMKDGDQNEGIPKVDSVDTKATSESKHGGGLLNLLSGLMRGGLAGGLMGAIGGLLTGGLLKPLFGIVKFMFTLGTRALALGGKLFAPIALITSIMTIVEGFMDAEKILGMTDLNIAEKLLAGFGNLGNVLIDAIDWIVNLIANEFGIHIPIKEFLLETLPDIMFKHIVWWEESVTDAFNYLSKTLPDEIIGFITSIPDRFIEFHLGIARDVDAVFDAGVNTIKNIFKDIADEMTGFVKGIFDTIKGSVREVKNKLSKIPGVSMFFGEDEETAESDNQTRHPINSKSLEDMARSLNGGNTDYALMIPWSSTNSSAAESILRAERETMKTERPSMMLNAPTTNQNVQNNNNIYNGETNTGNQNHRFRAMQQERVSF